MTSKLDFDVLFRVSCCLLASADLVVGKIQRKKKADCLHERKGIAAKKHRLAVWVAGATVHKSVFFHAMRIVVP